MLTHLKEHKKLFKIQVLVIFYTFLVNGVILLLVLFTDISLLGVGNNEHLIDLIKNNNGVF